MSNTFNLKLITPEGTVFEDAVHEISLPTTEGEITVLPTHTPLVTLIRPGEIVIKNNQKHHYLATDGGVAFIDNNFVKILSDGAESAESLSEAKILEAKKRAEEAIATATDTTEFNAAQLLLEKQLSRLKVLKRRKHS